MIPLRCVYLLLKYQFWFFSTPCAIKDDDDLFIWLFLGEDKSEALGQFVLETLGNDLLEFEEAEGILINDVSLLEHDNDDLFSYRFL